MRSHLLVGSIASIVLAVVFNYSLILNSNKPLSLLHGDAFLVNFILKHYVEIFSSGNWSQMPNLPMFYGFQNSLFFSDHHFIQALMALPVYLATKNIVTTSNLLIIMTTFLSLFSMYLLAFYWTKRFAPSITAAIIFVFNPFVMARFPDQLILISLQWIPATFLFLEKSIDQPNRKNLFLFFLFLTCQLLSSLYYSVFLTVILPVYALIRLLQKKVPLRTLINLGSITGLLLFSLTAILSAYLYSQVFAKEPINRTLISTQIYSARVSDWLFTAPENLIYGSFKEKAAAIAPSVVRLGIYSEQNLFWGFVPLSLFILSFKFLPKSTFKDIWLLSLGLLIVSAILSLGPKIVLSDNLSFPGLYSFVYKINPLLSFLRTPARFGVFVFFFLALIVAITLTQMTKNLKPKTQFVLGLAIALLILVEYWNRPLEFTTISPQTRQFYAVLKKQDNIKVILDLPIGNLISYQFPHARAEDLDTHYLLYATILHDKVLFNGYTGFLPQEYYRRANSLSVNFPTPTKLAQLKSWGVDGIILHKEEYNDPQFFASTQKSLEAQGVSLITTTAELALFDLTRWQEVP